MADPKTGQPDPARWYAPGMRLCRQGDIVKDADGRRGRVYADQQPGNPTVYVEWWVPRSADYRTGQTRRPYITIVRRAARYEMLTMWSVTGDARIVIYDRQEKRRERHPRDWTEALAALAQLIETESEPWPT